MKVKNAIVAGLIALCTSSFAAIVDVNPLVAFDGGVADRVVTKEGVSLVSGFAGTGVFSIDDAQVDALIAANDYAGLISTFTSVIGTDNFSTGTSNILGVAPIAGVFVINNSALNPAALVGKSIYTFFSDGAALAANGYLGLFKHAEAIVADPAPPALPNTYALSLTTGTIKIGTAGTGNLNLSEFGGSATNSVSSLQLINAVPEPSAALLGAIGVLGLLRRRRA